MNPNDKSKFESLARRLLAPLSLAVLLSGSSPPAAAAAPADNAGAAILIAVEGAVEYMRAGAQQWATASAGLKLLPGDRLRTGARSRATVQLANRMRQRLISSSTLFIEKPTSAAERAVPTLQRGSMYFQSRQRPRDQRFRTPLVSGAIRGTEFYLTVADNGETRLTLLDGEVDLENDKGKITLQAGEQGEVAPGGVPQEDRCHQCRRHRAVGALLPRHRRCLGNRFEQRGAGGPARFHRFLQVRRPASRLGDLA